MDLGELGNIGMFPQIMVPQNGWFIVENPMKMDDLGGNLPLFLETPIDLPSQPFKKVWF